MKQLEAKMATEMLLWAEVVRRHYMSLEGAGPDATEEAGFFLSWHYEMRGNL